MDQPTRHELKLIQTATAVRDNPKPKNQKLAFLGRDFVQITLPHSDPGDIPIWTRQNGNHILSVRPAIKAGKILGYPYGTIPRLLLLWLTSEVLQKGSKKIYLGDSLAEFMRGLDLDPGRGGQRSDRQRLQKQSERFFRSIYTSEYQKGDETKGRLAWRDIQIAPEGEIWWDYSNEGENIFDGHITLSDQAFKMFTNSPVPVDMRTISAIKNSALAIDLFIWVTYKTFIANNKDRPQHVPWRGLIKQLGSAYGDGKTITKTNLMHFRAKAKAKFELIMIIHPTLRIDYYHGGVEISPAELVVERGPRKLR